MKFVTSRIVEVGSGSHNNASPGSQMLGTGCHGETSQLALCYVFSDSHLITTNFWYHYFRVRLLSNLSSCLKAPYTLSFKLSDFTVWRHTLRKNRVNCPVFIAIGQASELSFQSSFTHRTAHSTQRIPQFPQFVCRQHDGTISRHSSHSADEHRIIYSFSNTTSCSTFYAFFSSFRITSWPMWLANSKRQPCFYPPQSHAQEDTQNWQRNWQTWWETCAVPENIQFSFRAFFTQLNCTV